MNVTIKLGVCIAVLVPILICSPQMIVVGQESAGKAEKTTASQTRPDRTEKFKQKFLTAKRIVFLGDSNTHAGEFINQIEATLLSHHDSVAEIINLGLPSETCSGLSEPVHPFPRPDVHERLARALAQTKPDLVVACYGMNDGIYHPFTNERFATFQNGIRKLIVAHSEAKVPLILLTPPPFDPLPMRNANKLVPMTAEEFSWGKIYENYDEEVIQRYADWILSIDQPNCLVIDTHGPIKKYLVNKRLSDPDFAFSADGVHFDNAGHQVLADVVLKSLGIDESLATDEVLLKLVRERQAISHLAWLTAVGHLRPGVTDGLPMEEANKATSAIEKLIDAALIAEE